MTTRIGVVADTHCPEFLHQLPDRLFEVLRGVDLIIHAGDVNGAETISALEAIAPAAQANLSAVSVAPQSGSFRPT